MKEQMIQEVLTRIDAMGESLKYGGLKLGESAIKFTMFKAIGYLAINILCLIIIPIALMVFHRIVKKLDWEELARQTEGFFIFGYLIVLLIGIVCWIVSLLVIPQNLATIAAPAWATVLNVINTLKAAE